MPIRKDITYKKSVDEQYFDEKTQEYKIRTVQKTMFAEVVLCTLHGEANCKKEHSKKPDGTIITCMDDLRQHCGSIDPNGRMDLIPLENAKVLV
jgi:hypothetical protein